MTCRHQYSPGTTRRPTMTKTIRTFLRARAGAGAPPMSMHRSTAGHGVRRTARVFALGALAATALVATGLGTGVAQADGTGAGPRRTIVLPSLTSITTDKA